MRIYIAAQYGQKELMRKYAAELRRDGHIVTSTWLDEVYSPTIQLDELTPEQLATIAANDLEDIMSSDIVVLFTMPPTEKTVRGGRHVEFGSAIFSGIDVVICGPAENIFHYLELMPEFMHKYDIGRITRFDEWNQVRASLATGQECPN